MAEAMMDAAAAVTETELRAMGAPQLRALARAMRNKGMLPRSIASAAISGAKADEIVGWIMAALPDVRSPDAMRGLYDWARAKVGSGAAGAPASDGATEAQAIAPAASDPLGAMRGAMLAILGDALKAQGVDRDALNDAISEALDPIHSEISKLAARPPLTVVVKTDSAERKIEGRTHKMFPLIVKCIGAKCAPMLVGPAGSGKTHACEQAAEALALRFYMQSVCAQTTASTLLGYMDAQGRYVRSLFREAYEGGGLYLLDEIDNGNPNVLAVLNAALSNGQCAFPDGMIKRHPDFRLAAAANTWGNGRTTEYVGRNPIDAATLDRFVQIAFPYDDDLERDTSGNEAWSRYVQAFRAEIGKRGTRHMVTPRASIYGARLLAAGMDAGDVIATVLTRGLDDSTARAVLSAIGAFKGGK